MKLVIVGIVAAITGALITLQLTGVEAQSTVTPDPAFEVVRKVNTDNRTDPPTYTKIEVFRAMNTAQVYTWIYDSPTNVDIERLATADELSLFNARNDPSTLQFEQSQANLTGAQEGVNWPTFIANRTAALASCETDMQTGQANSFTALGANGQNLTINRMQECIELNSKNGRQLVNYLFDLLVERGIIQPSVGP